MNSGIISTRYARALLMSAKENKSADKVYAEMAAMGVAFGAYPEIKAMLSSPTVTPSEKCELLMAVAGSKASKETQNFISFVVNEGREDYMPAIARMYEQIYRKENNIVISTLTSAAELPESSVESMKKFIAKLSGSKNVEVRTTIDSSIIGGFLLDIDSSRLDASIKGQLNQLKYYAGH